MCFKNKITPNNLSENIRWIALILILFSLVSPVLAVDYDRQAAVDYAEQYAKILCPCGISYYEYGGDCTHFVSEALSAGRLSNRNTPYARGWCQGGAQDYIITVRELRQWFQETGVATQVSSVDNLEKGDVILTAWNNDQKRYTHATLYLGSYKVASHSPNDFYNYNKWGPQNEYWHITSDSVSTFAIKDKIQVVVLENTGVSGLKVRDSPAGNQIGVKYDGDVGTVIDGPKSATLNGLTYSWLRIQWNDGLVGWSAEKTPSGAYFIEKVNSPITGSISLNSIPNGVSLYLDGLYRGTTPMQIDNLATGQHSIRLSKSGYQELTATVNVLAASTTPYSFTLNPIVQTGSMYVSSSPTGAIITLDGTDRGTTPLQIDNLAPGQHSLQLSKVGHSEFYDTINLQPGMVIDFHYELLPPLGSLSISSSPSGAALYLNGIYQGTTPKQIDHLVTGQHTIRLSKESYQDLTTTATVQAASTTSYSFVLNPIVKSGSISVTSSPTGALVTLDGVNKGITPIKIDNLGPGQHSIRLSKGGYHDATTTVTVLAGATSPYSYTLNPVAQAVRTGSIYVSSSPTGALVTLDGVNKGTTPIRIDNLTSGQYSLQLSKEGYKTLTNRIIIRSNEVTYRIEFLKPLPNLQKRY